MKSPFIPRCRQDHRSRERGVTMALVAVAIFSIIAMAALSIDLCALYLAREEAQRTADAAALAGARVLSLSGMTGDTADASNSWTPACTAATQAATSTAQQNSIGGTALPTAQITVSFPNNSNCGSAAVFGVNPQVTVSVTRQSLPTFFTRLWGVSSAQVSATATAEAFNPSDSVAYAGTAVPVQPRCVKPWIIPNADGGAAKTFVDIGTGTISKPGVNLLGGGVIGESFTLSSPCKPDEADCDVTNNDINPLNASGYNYVVAKIEPSPYTAVPNACPANDDYQMAISGCDQVTQYNCGTTSGMQINLDIPPVTPKRGGDTFTATQCLINSATGGQDTLNTGSAKTPIFPFQIAAGLDDPLVQGKVVNNNDLITRSNSIVSLPIYDTSTTGFTFLSNQQAVTIVGFLQVFINDVHNDGSIDVTVLNVSGCTNNATTTAINGTSPVPVRLITP